jgi:hypothetical protein
MAKLLESPERDSVVPAPMPVGDHLGAQRLERNVDKRDDLETPAKDAVERPVSCVPVLSAARLSDLLDLDAQREFLPSPPRRRGPRPRNGETRAQVTARVAAVRSLNADAVPYVVAGAYALRKYARIFRETKDLDIFCRRRDVEAILASLARVGFRVEHTDPLWLAKGIAADGEFVDVIFSSGNGVAEVDDLWFSRAREGTVLGERALFALPEEIIWSKCFVQERERYDGADVHHLIRACGKTLDWSHLRERLAAFPEVLLAHLLLFRFSFPGDRDVVPAWLLDTLMEQVRLPPALGSEKTCRGTLLSRVQYEVDLARGLLDARPLEVPAFRAFHRGNGV